MSVSGPTTQHSKEVALRELVSSADRVFEVLIIGGGVIGLSTAFELAREGVDCCLIAAGADDGASGAAAGLLAPSIGSDLPPIVQSFFVESLERYPAFIESLETADAGLRILRGLIEIPRVAGAASRGSNGITLLPRELAELEPAVESGRGGVLYPSDGAIDNVRLLTALREAVGRQPNVFLSVGDPVVAIDAVAGSARVASGAIVRARHIVLAAGAWSPLIAGLPRSLAVTPLKGQMLAVEANVLGHPIMGEDVYLVPRGDETVIGATVERAGFNVETTEAAIGGLRRAAAEIVPSLGPARETRRWAGVRPATPDMLPIIGRGPEAPALIYACGHSKNGILLAPATARAVADLVLDRAPAFDLSPFAVDRFDSPG